MIAFKDNFQNNKSQINIINFNIYKDIIETQNELNNIKIEIKNTDAVKIVADAKNPKKPLGVTPFLNYMIFSILGLITAIFFIIIKDKLKNNPL